jgi:hypothetical protein
MGEACAEGTNPRARLTHRHRTYRAKGQPKRLAGESLAESRYANGPTSPPAVEDAAKASSRLMPRLGRPTTEGHSCAQASSCCPCSVGRCSVGKERRRKELFCAVLVKGGLVITPIIMEKPHDQQVGIVRCCGARCILDVRGPWQCTSDRSFSRCHLPAIHRRLQRRACTLPEMASLPSSVLAEQVGLAMPASVSPLLELRNYVGRRRSDRCRPAPLWIFSLQALPRAVARI